MIHVSNMAVPTPRRSPQETSFVSRRDLTQLRLGSVPMCLQVFKYTKRLAAIKGWGLSAKLGKHSAIWGKLGTALQVYSLNPCTKFPPIPTSRKVNT